MNKIIYLPVSLGEAIDKLTILDIKLDNIKDSRKIDVKVEYDLLYDKLKDFINKYNDLYSSMKKVNLIIWKQMDILRDGDTTSEIYMKICKECIEMNDVRFRIKNKINMISNSSIKEQKGYKISRILIDFNLEDDSDVSYDSDDSYDSDNVLNIFINAIKYLSYTTDEIIIFDNHSKKNNKNNNNDNNDNNDTDLNLYSKLSHFFSYDTTIKFVKNLENDIEYIRKIKINKYNSKDIYTLFGIDYTNIELL
jgi:hypothetical protein